MTTDTFCRRCKERPRWHAKGKRWAYSYCRECETALSRAIKSQPLRKLADMYRPKGPERV